MKNFANSSLTDALNLIKEDLMDTLNNQTGALNSLYSWENGDINNGNLNFAYNNMQYKIELANNDVATLYRITDSSPVICGQYNKSDGELVDDYDFEHNELDFESIDDIEKAMLVSSENTSMMMDLANVIDGYKDDPTQDVLSRFSAIQASTIGSADNEVKECYNNICTYMAGDTSATGAFNWIVNQYKQLAAASSNGNEMVFSENAYVVQGFAGSYALSVIFTTLTSVISAVATVISPIIGIAVGLIGSLFSALISLLPNDSDTQLSVHDNAANSLFAVPIFQSVVPKQQVWNATDEFINWDPDYMEERMNYRFKKVFEDNGSAYIRTNFFVVRIGPDTDPNNMRYEILLSLDCLKYNNNAFGKEYVDNGSPQNAYKSKHPFFTYLTQNIVSDDGNGWNPGTLAPGSTYRNLPQSEIGFIRRFSKINEYATKQDNISMLMQDYSLSNSKANEVYDYNFRAVVFYLIGIIMDRLARIEYDADEDNFPSNWYLNRPTKYDPAIYWENSYTPGSNSTAWDWASYIFGRILNKAAVGDTNAPDPIPSWDFIVNTMIPTLRIKYQYSSRPLKALAQIFADDWDQLYEEYSFIPGDYSYKDLKFIPPKYSQNAFGATLAIIIGAAVVTTVCLVGKQILKVQQRKKQIHRYNEVQRLGAIAAQTGTDADAKAFRKAVRRYNRWASFTGTSRLSAISGWETGETGSIVGNPTSLSGLTNSDKSSITRAQQNYNDSDAAILSKRILHLLDGE